MSFLDGLKPPFTPPAETIDVAMEMSLSAEPDMQNILAEILRPDAPPATLNELIAANPPLIRGSLLLMIELS
jgi:hypothetical protein